MSLADWLFGILDRNPEPPLPLQIATAGGRVAAMRANGELWVWDLRGAFQQRFAAAGSGVALSPDGELVVGGDGVVHGPAQSYPAPMDGACAFVGGELLRVGWDRLGLGPPSGPPRLTLPHKQGAPSPALRVLPGARSVAIVDPAWEQALILEPTGGALYGYAGGLGAVQGATWLGGRLAILQEGTVFLEGDAKPLRPHALQTLAVAARGDDLVSVGLDAQDRYELRDGGTTPLPGPAPERPWLAVAGEGVAVQTRAGVAAIFGGRLGLLELPPRRRRAPPFVAWPILVDPARLLVPLWPPAIYRLADMRCEVQFEDRK